MEELRDLVDTDKEKIIEKILKLRSLVKRMRFDQDLMESLNLKLRRENEELINENKSKDRNRIYTK